MQCGREPPSEKVAGVAQELRTVQFANWFDQFRAFLASELSPTLLNLRTALRFTTVATIGGRLIKTQIRRNLDPALIAGIHNLDGNQFSSQPRQDLLKESGPDQVLRSHRRSSFEFDPQVEVRRSVRRLTVPYGQQAASGHAQNIEIYRNAKQGDAEARNAVGA